MAFLVNIIGAGNLGKTIGYLLVKHKLVTIGAICNSSKISSIDAIKFIGQGKYCPTIDELPPADLTFITTPDDLIKATCEALSQNKFIKQGSIALHCSGLLTSDALVAVKEKGCYVASIHPMRSFAKPELSVEQYKGTYCAIEGDSKAMSVIQTIFNSIGSITYEIDKTKKASYHTAGVFASNYLVTLAEEARLCMQEAGVENELAMQVITTLMQGTVTNLANTLSPAQSLTGPIKRGDTATISKHMQSLAEEQKKLYSALGKATVSLTNHNTLLKEKIIHALDSHSSNR